MLNVVRSFANFLRGKLAWHHAGMAVGIAITAIALFVLYRMLRGIDPVEVLAAIRATDPVNIFFAALFVAAGYLTLTLYDYFALRTIGRNEVPYRVAAIAGFTSYSIGHNVGFTAFSGGTVRYRVYSTTSGMKRDRSRQDLLHRGSDVLARQHCGAWARICRSSGSGVCRRSAAAADELLLGICLARGTRRLHNLGQCRVTDLRTWNMVGHVAVRQPDAPPNLDRRH